MGFVNLKPVKFAVVSFMEIIKVVKMLPGGNIIMENYKGELKKFICGILFVGGFCWGITICSWLLYPSNDIIKNWQSFYKQDKDSIDCLFVGSSHVFASFDPAVFDPVLGKRTYVLASNSQTVTQAYYNVKEVLNYQCPDTIVLEASSLDGNSNWQNGKTTDETFDKDWKKESNIDGMRLGQVKLEAIIQQYTKKNWGYALCRIGRSHSNWKNLKIAHGNWAFLWHEAKDFTGFRPSKTKMSEETKKEYEEMEKQEGTYKISEVNEEHFHKLARLCRDREIRLILVMAPMYDRYIQKIDYESRYDEVTALACSEGLDYIDCNKAYAEIGLEAEDFEDAFSSIVHLNKQGAEKVSRYVARRMVYNREQ